MIKLLKAGNYQLIETKGQVKILSLDDQTFAWVNAAEIGELLVSSQNPHKTDHILALGKYRLYEVGDEAHFTDLEHLELFVGEGKWQGYLLTSGLPDQNNKRKRIIPTDEIITKFTH